MTYFLLYLLFILPQISEAAGIGLVLLGVVLAIIFVVMPLFLDDDIIKPDSRKKIIRAVIVTGVLCVFLKVAIPDEEGLVMIVAGGATYDVITSEPAKQLGGKGLDLLNKYLDEKIAEFDKTTTTNTTEEPK